MIEISETTLLIACVLTGSAIVFQLVLSSYLLIHLRLAHRDRTHITREMFGLLKKIEGLTAHRREQMLKHYDTILEDLSTRLPPTIAAEAGQVIFETERRILTRLAELEPNLKEDEQSRERMDELIRTMENLENTIVSLTADTVSSIMAESRRDLFRDDYSHKNTLAA